MRGVGETLIVVHLVIIECGSERMIVDGVVTMHLAVCRSWTNRWSCISNILLRKLSTLSRASSISSGSSSSSSSSSSRSRRGMSSILSVGY